MVCREVPVHQVRRESQVWQDPRDQGEHQALLGTLEPQAPQAASETLAKRDPLVSLDYQARWEALELKGPREVLVREVPLVRLDLMVRQARLELLEPLDRRVLLVIWVPLVHLDQRVLMEIPVVLVLKDRSDRSDQRVLRETLALRVHPDSRVPPDCRVLVGYRGRWERQDQQVLVVPRGRQDLRVPVVSPGLMGSLVLLGVLVFRDRPVSKDHQELLGSPAAMDQQDSLVQPVDRALWVRLVIGATLETKDHKEDQVLVVPRDQLVALGYQGGPVYQAHQGRWDHRVMLVVLEPRGPLDLQGWLERWVCLDLMATLAD